jgi:hypothetical protein
VQIRIRVRLVVYDGIGHDCGIRCCTPLEKGIYGSFVGYLNVEPIRWYYHGVNP